MNDSLIRRNKKLESFLLAIGFALFVLLGMKGIEKINDKAVAAGEAYKNAAVQAVAPEEGMQIDVQPAQFIAYKQAPAQQPVQSGVVSAEPHTATRQPQVTDQEVRAYDQKNAEVKVSIKSKSKSHVQIKNMSR